MRCLWFQILIIVVVSTGVGIGVNALAPEPLPLLNVDGCQFINCGGPAGDEIIGRWQAGELFIDARVQESYEAGHIPGAFSLPYHDFDHGTPDLVEELRSYGLPLVIYCDGADCQASDLVSQELLKLGFAPEEVHVYSGGWQEWQELRPDDIETGSANGLFAGEEE